MYQRGFSSLIVSLFIGLVLLTGTITYLYYQDDATIPNVQNKTENSIDSAVINKMRALGLGSGFDPINSFDLTNIDGNYARGEVIINGVKQNVHLISVNGEDWVVVEISEDPISCEKAEKMGYPSSMVSDCLYVHPGAEDVAVVLAWSKDELISADEIEIIGEVNLGDDPAENTFEIISDDGESVTINYDPDDETYGDISDGDYVVVTVTPSEGEDGEVELNLNDIEEIETVEDVVEESNSITDLEPNLNDDEDENDSENTDNNTEDSTTDSSTSDSNTQDSQNTDQTTGDSTQPSLDNEPITNEYDIPDAYADTEEFDEKYYYNLLDRDNSGGLRIISDF